MHFASAFKIVRNVINPRLVPFSNVWKIFPININWQLRVRQEVLLSNVTFTFRTAPELYRVLNYCTRDCYALTSNTCDNRPRRPLLRGEILFHTLVRDVVTTKENYFLFLPPPGFFHVCGRA